MFANILNIHLSWNFNMEFFESYKAEKDMEINLEANWSLSSKN